MLLYIMSQFEAIYIEYYSYILTYLQRRCSNYQNAEDLTQDVFVKVYLHRSDLEHITNTKSWLLKIAENTFRDSLRKKCPQTISWSEYGNMLLCSEDYTIERLYASHQIAVIVSCMNSTSDQLILHLLMIGYSPIEIAEELEISHQAVRSRLFRMRRSIKKELSVHVC